MGAWHQSTVRISKPRHRPRPWPVAQPSSKSLTTTPTSRSPPAPCSPTPTAHSSRRSAHQTTTTALIPTKQLHLPPAPSPVQLLPWAPLPNRHRIRSRISPHTRSAYAVLSRAHAHPASRWTCIYPIYIDAKRPYGRGERRIAREKSVWWPLSKDIADATNRLGLGTLHEVNKSHPRDWENPGRVRVQWKKDGRLVNSAIKTSASSSFSSFLPHLLLFT